MITLLLAAAIYTNCLNCVNGFVEIPCKACNGTGYQSFFERVLVRGKRVRVPCKKCSRGLFSYDRPGTGKIRIKCPICKGKKKLKKN